MEPNTSESEGRPRSRRQPVAGGGVIEEFEGMRFSIESSVRCQPAIVANDLQLQFGANISHAGLAARQLRE
jgi:hypothetical protein